MGHVYDTVLDIYFAEARFLDAKNRQWLSSDPMKDGLNWYQYVGANPVSWVDPSGLSPQVSPVFSEPKTPEVETLRVLISGHGLHTVEELREQGIDWASWEDTLYDNISKRIDALDSKLTDLALARAIDEIIYQEAEKLQDQFRTIYNASSGAGSYGFAGIIYDTLKPLFTDFKRPSTEAEKLLHSFLNGFFAGLDVGIWYSTMEWGLESYFQRMQCAANAAVSGAGNPVYNANGDPALRATRRPGFDDMRSNGVNVNGTNYKLNDHAYNSMFKSGRKDIMPVDVSDALKVNSVPGNPGSVVHVNPATGTQVFVNPSTNEIVGIWPASFGQ